MVTVNFLIRIGKNPVGINLFFTGITPFPVYMVILYSVLFLFFERLENVTGREILAG